MTVQSLDDIHELAQQLRVDSIRCSTAAGSGHPTSSMSAADLMAVLMARHLRYDWQRPDDPANDHLIFSKGHASPLLYSMFKAAGVVSDEELMTGYRRFGSRLEGHPTPVLPWVDVATGSLGQGLPDGVGVALAGRYLDELPYRVWVLCGDSEMAEGSMWEALDKASYYRLSNLTAIVDVNRLGQRGPTELGWDLDAYARRVEAFGCHAIAIDGHDLGEIDKALRRRGRCRPAHRDPGPHPQGPRVRRGRRPRGLARPAAARGDGRAGHRRARRRAPSDGHRPAARGRDPPGPGPSGEVSLPRYELGAKVATRLAFGQALAAVGARGDVVALDGEVGNSTHLEEFAKAYPERYFEMFIAEQQLVAAAVGLPVRGYVPFAATFAAFFTRAYDFIRMSAISQANIRLCGSHCGRRDRRGRPVADGPGGPGHDARRARLHGPVPQRRDERGVPAEQMAERTGIVYMRTTRGAYPVLYGPDEAFPIGGAKVAPVQPGRPGDADRRGRDRCTTAWPRPTSSPATASAPASWTCTRSSRSTPRPCSRRRPRPGTGWWSSRTTTRQGGIGSAVLDAFNDAGHPVRISHLAVRGLPGSGTPAELMEAAGISAGQIAQAARDLLSG